MQSLSAPSSTTEETLTLLESSLEVSAEMVSLESASLLPTHAEILTDEISDGAPAWKQGLQVFASTFFTIFLAELGDKTQLTTLLMAAESHSPWIVFAGAAAALIATSAIGCWLGCWLSKRVSPQMLERSVGVLLLFVSALLVWDVIQG
ncbi:TMEM165/GDT1 family protein [Leptolyngbya ohadii]|uniref:TMEM165/GDT1 family protein n=1 Tax=Leptolyngbya ohadii TaxID=1962290 RepID=UPI0021F0A439|nr:TMEM165/GDT1 family protein [Leptolyngbya ohadii]